MTPSPDIDRASLDSSEELNHLRDQIRGLAAANAYAAELMADLQEARDLHALLEIRNCQLIDAQGLERDRNLVLELVTRNEPLDVVLNALHELVEHRNPGSSFSVSVLEQSGPLSLYSCAVGRRVSHSLNNLSVALLPAGDVKVYWSSDILAVTGKLLGTISFYEQSGAEAQRPNSELLQKVALLAGLSIEHRQLYEQLAYQATHDSLTGLPNRALFHDLLDRAISVAAHGDRKMAVLLIDLDRFKFINDTFGHRTGDELLRQIAGRVSKCLCEGDIAARLSGDEFAVLLSGIQENGVAEYAAERIVHALQTPFLVFENELVATASIGISVYPEHGANAIELIKNADAAMYSAKRLGKNMYQLFAIDEQGAGRRRLEIERRLRNALARDEFHLQYQPQCGSNGKPLAVEALLRWDNPELGSVGPAEFIPIAESTGLIIAIGDWVLERACRQAAKWAGEGHPLRIAVNVSMVQFLRTDVSETIGSLLYRNGLDPSLLEIELTESTVMTNPNECATRLNRIRQLGVRLSIDDFGIGYSSLSHLQNLCIDTLKIDRSFIGRLDVNPKSALPVVVAIIRMAQSLQLNVIAEGVETWAQMDALLEAGCDVVQGYLFHRPMSALAVSTLLIGKSDPDAVGDVVGPSGVMTRPERVRMAGPMSSSCAGQPPLDSK